MRLVSTRCLLAPAVLIATALWCRVPGQQSRANDGISPETGHVASVSFSPDSRLLAFGAPDGTVQLWDVAARKQIATLKGHDAAVAAVAFSPDGKTLASGGRGWNHKAGCPGDSSVVVWDVARRQKAATLKGHAFGVLSVAFSPDGKTLASGGDEPWNPAGATQPPDEEPTGGEIRLWDATTGQEKATFQGHGARVSCVAFSPDGKTLAAACGGGIKLWSVASKKETVLAKEGADGVQCLAFSPDGKTLAAGDNRSADMPGEVTIWDMATRKAAAALHGPAGRIAVVAFSPGGKTLAAGSSKGNIVFWDTSTGRNTATLNAGATSVAFSPDGKLLAGVRADGGVQLWDLATRKQAATLVSPDRPVQPVRQDAGPKKRAQDATPIRAPAFTLEGHTDRVTALAFGPDGKTLVSRSHDRSIRLWDVAGRKSRSTLRENLGVGDALALSRDGTLLAGEDLSDGAFAIRLWHVPSGKEVVTLRQAYGSPLAFSPDGKFLAVGARDITLWDVTARRPRTVVKGQADEVTALAFRPDGKVLTWAGEDDGMGFARIRLWDVAGQKVTGVLESPPVKALVFSPDGKALALVCADDADVLLLDVASRKPRTRFEGHARIVHCLAFHPDGNWLASGGEDETIKLWEAATGKQIAALAGHTDRVTALAFSPDGKTLASASYDHTIKLWEGIPNGGQAARPTAGDVTVTKDAARPSRTNRPGFAMNTTLLHRYGPWVLFVLGVGNLLMVTVFWNGFRRWFQFPLDLFVRVVEKYPQPIRTQLERSIPLMQWSARVAQSSLMRSLAAFASLCYIAVAFVWFALRP